jgi:nucleotide-binding universal stress UspA family protein
MFETILVPLDGSARAEQAIPVAARIAQANDGMVILLRVLNQPQQYIWYPLGQEPAYSASYEERGQVLHYLRDLTFSEPLRVLATSIEVARGDPAEVILDMAQSYHASLIVMNSHGESGPIRWFFGSVSLKVASHGRVPVLVLRPEQDRVSTSLNGQLRPLRVLVPLDGSPCSEEALLPAAYMTRALSAPGRGTLQLTCVIPAHTRDQKLSSKLAETYLKDIEADLRSSEAGKDLEITTTIPMHLDVAEALVKLAEGRDELKDAPASDVIAIATHGRGGLARWVMGSITERVFDMTMLPLLVVRSHKTHPFRHETHSTNVPRQQAGSNGVVLPSRVESGG